MSYSPNLSTFFIGESFATARSFAIPLGVLSVAALAATQRGWALGFGIAAAALHPLHGVWPLALWLLAGLRTPVALLVVFLPPAVALLLGRARPIRAIFFTAAAALLLDSVKDRAVYETSRSIYQSTPDTLPS